MKSTESRKWLVLALLTLLLVGGTCDESGGTACSVKCQHIEDTAQWEQCMEKCHAELR